jgi:Bacterial Ig-like domain (group 2).
MANDVVLGGGTGTWSSSNTEVATVDTNGLVTAKSAGTTTITYTITGGCNGTPTKSKSLEVRANAEITKITIDDVETSTVEFNYGCKTPQLRVYATGYQSFLNPLRYQWYVNDSPIPGAILPIYNVPSATGVGTYYYKVVVTGYCASDERTVIVTINQQPADADLDAQSYYTGPNVAWTPTATSNTATVTLSAFLKNSTAEGAECGDISTARVTFMANGKAIPSATNLPVNFVDPANPSKGGTASAIVQLTIPSGNTYNVEIKVVISGNYTANDTIGTISELLIGKLVPGGAIGGGAKLLNINSSGFVKGALLRRTEATFGVDYTVKGGKIQSPKGTVTMLIPSFNDRFGNYDNGILHWYFVKSNAIASLAITSPTATFTSKANIAEYYPATDTQSSIEGNCVMVVELGDYCTTGKSNILDKVGVTVYRNAGGVWYSNNWVSTKTVMTNIFGGDVSVSGAISSTAAKVAAGDFVQESTVTETGLKVYPSPFSGQLNISLQVPTDSHARLELFDLNGRRVALLYNDDIKGNQYYQFTYIPTMNISQGVMTYRLILNDKVLTGKVIYKSW